MLTPCTYCGKPLQRWPSRIQAHAQFCGRQCHNAYQVHQRVAINCAQCGQPMSGMAPSRAAQSKAHLCSPACLSAYLSAAVIRYWDSAERRVASCAHCGKEFTRAPSQLAKHAMSFCSRTCRAQY